MFLLLEEVSPVKYQPLAPKYLYSNSGYPSIMVMEDLKVRIFKVPEGTLGLDFEHSLSVVLTLARFHATSVVIRNKEPHVLKALMYQDRESFFRSNHDGVFNSSLRELKKEMKN
jgi:hypothetical protein